MRAFVNLNRMRLQHRRRSQLAEMLLDQSVMWLWKATNWWFDSGGRGVQYMHWVMHKCIMVKTGGKRNTRKVCKKQVNLSKTEGKFVKSKGEIIIFAKQGGEMYWNRENRGKFEICGWWLKKIIRNFGGWKSRILSGKDKIVKIFLRVRKFFDNRGKSETGVNASWSQRGWMPLLATRVRAPVSDANSASPIKVD